jgi:hypothetical protein
LLSSNNPVLAGSLARRIHGKLISTGQRSSFGDSEERIARFLGAIIDTH